MQVTRVISLQATVILDVEDMNDLVKTSEAEDFIRDQFSDYDQVLVSVKDFVNEGKDGTEADGTDD